ncbi:MAG: S8 family serine peptidase [Alphaproteobacteria bacterium]
MPPLTCVTGGGLAFNSSGNEGQEQSFSDMPNLITVLATDTNDQKTSWSNYGAFIDLAAPGYAIYTTIQPDGYQALSGTSLASPLVAGVAALMLSANPALTGDDVQHILETTAVDLGSPGWDKYYGHGRVDAAAAVQMARDYTPSERDTTPPSVAIDNPASGSTVSGTVVVGVTAHDNVGATRVDFLSTARSTGTAISPYSLPLRDTSSLGNAGCNPDGQGFDKAGNNSDVIRRSCSRS